MSFKASINTGGTFTDAICVDSQGNLFEAKWPNTPHDPSVSILSCLDELAKKINLERRILISNIDTLVHSTTQASDAIANRSGPRIGIIATQGHTDTIQLRRVRKDNMWDWRKPFPQPLVPRHLRVGVEERLDAKGNVVRPLNEASVHKAVAYLKKMGVQSIVVTFLFSFLNPAHELRVREIIKEDLPEVEVTLSHEVLSVSGEYERFNTAVIDAYLRPVMANYVKKLETLLKGEGFKGQLLLMQNNGGVETAEVIFHKPSTLVVSGPAAGPTAALSICDSRGTKNLLSLDIGGTSADIAILDNGEFIYRNESTIDDHRFSLPIVDVETLGAGGGGIAWFDLGDTLHVGPRSAGASPGPACYGNDGQEVTFTDAAVVLGYLNPDTFLWGQKIPNKDLAHKAIKEKVATRLGISPVEAAAAVYRISNSLMASSILHYFVTKGFDLNDFAFCAGGAASPLCAFKIAEELKMKQVIIPKHAAVYTSLGMLNADIRHNFIRYYSTLATELDLNKVKSLYQEMEKEGHRLMEQEGILPQQRSLVRTLRIKYYGQFRDLEVPWPNGPITEHAISEGISNFHHRHKEMFGSCDEKHPLELMKFGLTAIGHRPKITFKELPEAGRDPSSALKGQRDAYFEESQGIVNTPVYDGSRLRTGNTLKGPCIVEEMLTTLVIPPGFDVRIDGHGNYVAGGGN
jgi:N-methylhydantoinase A